MSLHLGNLSSRVRKDELERVFERFGRCNVRVKDRFGFVVYDVPGNAEKALRNLRGKRICGESISLSWSNRQPRPLQRTVNGRRSYESHHRRNSARENHVNKKLDPAGRREFRLVFKQPDADVRRFSSTDIPEETTKYDQDIGDNASEKDQNIKEDLTDKGGGTKSVLMDNDRWEEQVGNQSNENDMQNGLEFDRYEPYHGDGDGDSGDSDDRRDEDEMNHAVHQAGSTAVEDSQDKPRIVKSGEPALNLPVNMKSKQTCYICGDLGHKMRDCPRGKDAKRKKSRSSGLVGRIITDRRPDDKMNGSGEGEYTARGSRQPDRDEVMVRAHKGDRDSSRSRKLRKTQNGKSPTENETNRTRTTMHWEKRRRDNRSPERQHTKKSRNSVLTPGHADYGASKSKTKRSTSRSISRSRLRSRSLSPLSSSSTSHPTRYGKCKSGSRLRSRSKSKSKSKSKPRLRSRSMSTVCLSLSASVSQSLLSSPNKGQITGNPSVKAASLDSKEILFGQREVLKTDTGSGNSKLQSGIIAVESRSATPFKLNEDVDTNHSQTTNDNNLVMSKDFTKETNIFAMHLKETDPTGQHLSPNSLRETKDSQICDPFISEHVQVTTKNHESEVVLRSHTVYSKNITSEEIYMALEHYGLQHPDESEKDLPLETYFGSARFWPWEIIYYRRLRKGPISTENYARRITQNEEFGIVDKYVRSSSGWGECEEHSFS